MSFDENQSEPSPIMDIILGKGSKNLCGFRNHIPFMDNFSHSDKVPYKISLIGIKIQTSTEKIKC